MRKIEEQMNAAIRDNRNWSKGNTMVTTDEDVSKVFLHGNHIATVDDDSITLYDGGWQSVTTKSRLNAILDEFGMDGERVFQKDFVWYVSRFVGQAGTSKVYNADEFVNGYMLG